MAVPVFESLLAPKPCSSLLILEKLPVLFSTEVAFAWDLDTAVLELDAAELPAALTGDKAAFEASAGACEAGAPPDAILVC